MLLQSRLPAPPCHARKSVSPILSALVFSAVLLSGCAAVGPDFQHPASPDAARYTETPLAKQTVSSAGAGGKAQRFIEGQDIPSQWWQVFHSDALNDLIKRGLAHNPTLEASQASLRQAQENLRAEVGSAYYPAVTGSLGAQREKASAAQLGGAAGGSSEFSLYNASVNISYTLDVFGGARREVEALRALVDYQQYQLQASTLTLTANIVTSAINEASLRTQIAATHELIDSQQNELKVIQTQFDLGAVSRAEVLLQQTQLAQTRATLPPLEKGLSQTRNALAILVGSLPADAELPSFDLDKLQLPAELPISLPAELVRQRPDVRAAEALLHQANAQIGVATANQLPQFTLSGSIGSSATRTGDLFSSGSSVWNIGANLLAPIFNAGSLSAKRRAAVAAYDVSAAQYRLSVLTAFQNVADTLRALETDAQALQAQTDAESAAAEALTMNRTQYQLGAISYLQLLLAERQYQQSHISRIQAQAARYADTAALFQALGGDWGNANADTALITAP
ncbi:efflux transporter outer membrane subunit [Pseudolysobacter antarcticus]|uniref:Efflux transporter outer membrane subunit n=1 Tax=Pseudolysobacter antarcticus TaxID=2511995 RepID=A0A411HL46_9GAMM|nr:efflux transporter outer membrane subunit [Pseudolysobacter antarcticus]